MVRNIIKKQFCCKLNTMLCIVSCLFLSSFHIDAVFAEGRNLDVYLIYTAKDKEVMKQLKSELRQKNLRVKKYSLDLLALADYSVKQKKTAKFNTAKVVVIVTTRDPNRLISIDRLNNSILVNQFSSEIANKIEQAVQRSSLELP